MSNHVQFDLEKGTRGGRSTSFEERLMQLAMNAGVGVLDFAEMKATEAHVLVDFDRQLVDSFVRVDDFLISPLDLKTLEAPYSFDKSPQRTELFMHFSAQDAGQLVEHFKQNKRMAPRKMWISVYRERPRPTIVLEMTPKSATPETKPHEAEVQSFLQNVALGNWPLGSRVSTTSPGGYTAPVS